MAELKVWSSSSLKTQKYCLPSHIVKCLHFSPLSPLSVTTPSSTCSSHPPTNPDASSSSSPRASPHPDMPGHDGRVGAVGLHRHHCQRGGHEVHQGGRQQPGHQDPHCRDGRSSLSASGYVWCRLLTKLESNSNVQWTFVLWIFLICKILGLNFQSNLFALADNIFGNQILLMRQLTNHLSSFTECTTL